MKMTAPLLLFILGAICKSVLAYPSGAGSCSAGNAALQFSPHVMKPTIINGTLAQGGFTVTLDEVIKLDPDSGKTFIIGKDNPLVITGTKKFKGFLIRLGEVGGVVTDSALKPSSPGMQVSSLCTGVEGVGGVTHTNADDKESVTATLNLATEANSLPLDITIVVKNGGDTSEFYYSRFLLTAILPMLEVDPPTSAPVPLPVTTPMPTRIPTAGPTILPIPLPTLMPTPGPLLEPIPIPTLIPTPSPSLEPIPMPTGIPSPGPSLEPIPLPTSIPTPARTPPPSPEPQVTSPTMDPSSPPDDDDDDDETPPSKSPAIAAVVSLPTPSDAASPTVDPSSPPNDDDDDDDDDSPSSGTITGFPTLPPVPLFATISPVLITSSMMPASMPSWNPSSPHIIRNKNETCEDDKAYTFKVNGITRGCFWLSKRPEQKKLLCIPGSMTSECCEETCGQCSDTCKDNPVAIMNLTLQSSKFESKDCSWLSQHILVWQENCRAGTQAYMECKETCNNCANTMTCRDSAMNFTMLGGQGGTRERNCEWLAAHPLERERHCLLDEGPNSAWEVCPHTCGKCLVRSPL